MGNTVIKDTIVVKGVNPKANAKFKTAGGLLLETGSWINVAMGLDMKQFQKGKTYEVNREVLENGKSGNVVEVLGSSGKAAVSNFTGNGKTSFVDNSKGQREGAIGHYASRLTAALITAGAVSDVKGALAAFTELKKGIEAEF